MFGLRLPIDCAQRTKNGQPDQSTTGVARASSTQGRAAPSIGSKTPPDMAIAVTITVSGSVHQKRRRKSTSSGLSSSSRPGITGSSVIPHFGQVPGPIWRISGCIGQVYSVPGTGAGSVDG
jgi:hypothetical protein